MKIYHKNKKSNKNKKYKINKKFYNNLNINKLIKIIIYLIRILIKIYY